jgi:hypothetical protein
MGGYVHVFLVSHLEVTWELSLRCFDFLCLFSFSFSSFYVSPVPFSLNDTHLRFSPHVHIRSPQEVVIYRVFYNELFIWVFRLL